MVDYDLMNEPPQDGNLLASETGVDILEPSWNHEYDLALPELRLDTGSDYLDETLYGIMSLLVGPIQVLMAYRSMIMIALYARLVHLLMDLLSLKLENKILAKDFATTYFGLYQLISYVRSVQPTGAHSLLPICLSVIFSSAIISRLFKLGPPERSFRRTIAFVLFIAMPIFVNEYLIHHRGFDHHTTLRAIYMILAMKMTSEMYSETALGFVATLAYFLHPASCIMGPWHGPDSLRPRAEKPTNLEILGQFFNQITQTMMCLVMTFGALVVSTNLGELIEMMDYYYHDYELIKSSSRMYLTAQDFRFSHYFACLLSLTMMKLWQQNDRLRVCNILRVEWPRSLVEVVVSWNIPMHCWLKQCIFSPLIESRLSILTAILITYLCSSSLHGFKFHIWAVLFTLGLATWIEQKLRAKLARRLGACVLVRPCKLIAGVQSCPRGHKRTASNSVLVVVANFAFKLLAMLQLAYLGSIFVGNTDEASYRDALQKWSQCHYFGHLLCLAMMGVSICI